MAPSSAGLPLQTDLTDDRRRSSRRRRHAAPQATPQGPGFRILAQYVRDLSFENPKAPDSLRIDGKPAIDMGVEMNAQGRPDGLFEVDLRLTVKATTDDMARCSMSSCCTAACSPCTACRSRTSSRCC